MKKQIIKDLKAGDKVKTFFVAKHKQLEYFRDKSKGKFLTIILADRSGRILARVWEDAAASAEQFEEEDIILVVGRVEEYLGRPQIIVTKLRASRPDEKGKYYSEDDFVAQTDHDVDQLWAAVASAIEEMTNPFLKTLVQAIGDSLSAGLRAAPASKAMHHSYRGGLLEHIVEMLALSRCLFTLYPRIDRDLLTAGIILHDVGLVEGARYERDIDYSDAGRLAGHVVLGDRLVAGYMATIPNFPAALALSLSHMILSHHGQTEFGAVREPQTFEATALSLLNRLSAEVNHVQQVLDSQWDTSKPWTEYDRIMDRSYFRGRSQEPEPAPDGPAAVSQPASEAADEHAGEGPTLVAEQRARYAEKPQTGGDTSAQ
jgi:3'-5' exoribonuclease